MNKKSFNNIPHILWINLDRSRDRKKHMLDLFNENNIINHTRIPAIDSNTDINMYNKFKNPYFCTLSHLKALNYFINNILEEYCIICEDDISFELTEYWDKSINEYIDELPIDWECFKLYSNIFTFNKSIKYDNSYGAVIYIIKKSAARKILEYYNKLDFNKINYQIFLKNIIDVKMYNLCNTYVNSLFIYKLFNSLSNTNKSYQQELILIRENIIDEYEKINQKIPKIIHQIWIGNKIKPDFCLNSWKEKHPDYIYILWTEEEIKKRNMQFICQKQIDQNKHLCGKADIMRYEILYKYGGVYIDSDTYCLEKIDDLMNEEHLHYENETIRPNLIVNGFIFVKPKNKIIEKCINTIKNINDINIKDPHIITGPSLITEIYNENKYNINILPSYTFLPYHYTNNIYKGNNKIYGFHYWGSTKFTNFNYNTNKLYFPNIVLDNININNNFFNFIRTLNIN